MRKYIVIDGKGRIYSWEEILKQMRKRKGFEQDTKRSSYACALRMK